MRSPAEMTATFRILGNEFQIDYTVTNRTEQALFLTDVSLRITPEGATVQTGRPRIHVTPGGQVILHSCLPPPRREICQAAPPQAYASRLEAGSSIRRSLTLPLPLSPEGPPPRRPPRRALVHHVALLLGAIPAPSVPGAQDHEFGGVRVWRLPPDASRHQIELRAEARVPDLPVWAE